MCPSPMQPKQCKWFFLTLSLGAIPTWYHDELIAINNGLKIHQCSIQQYEGETLTCLPVASIPPCFHASPVM
ncbi:hypothetical protein V6Z11_A01G000600 [Gossypium hirsutum]